MPEKAVHYGGYCGEGSRDLGITATQDDDGNGFSVKELRSSWCCPVLEALASPSGGFVAAGQGAKPLTSIAVLPFVFLASPMEKL